VDLAQAGERDGEQGEDDESERDGGEVHRGWGSVYCFEWGRCGG
jgi:hypothetical protein